MARESPLPGMAPPVALAVPTENTREFCYVPFQKATWEDLQAARNQRVQNLLRTRKRLRDFNLKLDALRPYMEGIERTVAEASQLLQREAA